jgi:hypothetical protein
VTTREPTNLLFAGRTGQVRRSLEMMVHEHTIARFNGAHRHAEWHSWFRGSATRDRGNRTLAVQFIDLALSS